VAPSWETIAAKRHIFLMLTHLFYTANCYEVRRSVVIYRCWGGAHAWGLLCGRQGRERADSQAYLDLTAGVLREHAARKEGRRKIGSRFTGVF
jgi:hypothetical protein